MIEKIIENGLEFVGLFYSDYEGIVTKNVDPENRGRIQFKCQAVYGNNEPEIWALPKGMFSGKKIGFYAIPQVGDHVWISFRGGRPRFPMWQYGFMPKDYSIDGVSENVWKFRTVAGFQVELSEKEGEIYTITTPKGKTFIFDDKSGLISLKHENNNQVLLTDSDIIIKHEKNGEIIVNDHITVNAGGENLKNLIDTLIDTISNAVITTPAGPGAVAPPTKTQLAQIKTKIAKLLK